MTFARVALVLLLAGVAVAVAVFSSRSTEPESDPAPPCFRIFDEEERAVSGAEVQFFTTTAWELGARHARTVTSLADGGVPGAAPGGGEGVLAFAVINREGLPRVTVPLADLDGDVYLPGGRPVRGRVLDLKGKPIPKAKVMTPPLPPYAVETVADENGNFDLGFISEDAWIRASAPGYAVLDLCLSLYPLELDRAVFLLAPGYTITGRVMDQDGTPVGDAVVELEQESVTRLLAGPDGRFAFPGVLPNWEAVFSAKKQGHVGPPLTALCGESNIEVRLYRPASVSGAVTDGDSGDPISSFEVERREFTDRFEIGGLLPGRVHLAARAGHRFGEVDVTVSAGERLADVRIPLFLRQWGDPDDLRPGYSFEVTVLSGDQPIEGALVRYPDFGQQGRTDGSGRFRIRLVPGEHALTVGGDLEPHAKKELVVTIPDQESVSEALKPNPRVTLLLDGGVYPRDNVAYLKTADQERLATFLGEKLEFPVTADAGLELYVVAKACLPVFRRLHSLPESGVIRVSPRKGAFVTGRCIGESGDPLPKVVAELIELPPESRVETLGDGRFRIGPVHRGHFRIQLTGRNVRTFKDAIVVPRSGLDIGTVKLLSPADLLIRVTTSDGAPVARAEVRTTYRVEARGMTDPAGRLTLPGTEPSEMIRVHSKGLLDGWQDVRLPDESYREEIHVTLYRPARIVIRAMDENRRPVHLVEPLDLDADVLQLRSDQLLLTNVHPGPLVVSLQDRDGRKGEIRITVIEGEERSVEATLE